MKSIIVTLSGNWLIKNYLTTQQAQRELSQRSGLDLVVQSDSGAVHPISFYPIDISTDRLIMDAWDSWVNG